MIRNDILEGNPVEVGCHFVNEIFFSYEMFYIYKLFSKDMNLP